MSPELVDQYKQSVEKVLTQKTEGKVHFSDFSPIDVNWAYELERGNPPETLAYTLYAIWDYNRTKPADELPKTYETPALEVEMDSESEFETIGSETVEDEEDDWFQ